MKFLSIVTCNDDINISGANPIHKDHLYLVRDIIEHSGNKYVLLFGVKNKIAQNGLEIGYRMDRFSEVMPPLDELSRKLSELCQDSTNS